MGSFLRSIGVVAAVVIGMPAHGAWQPAGLQGSNVLSLAEDPGTGTTWYAGTASGFVYKKAGAGDWAVASGLGHAVLALAIAPATGVVYAGLEGGGLFKSADGGTTWSAAAGMDGLSVANVAIDPLDPSILFAAANGQIYRSGNAGSSWQLVDSQALSLSNVQQIAFEPPPPANPPARTETIYAAALGGLFQSVDAGTTWTPLDTSGSRSFSAIAVDPANRSVVYAGTADAGMYRSADGGSSWTHIDAGPDAADVVAIALYPYAPTSLLVGTGAGGIYRTDTSGGSWYAWNEGNAATRVNAVAFLAPQATSMLAATPNGVISFDNSGPDLVATAVAGPASANTEDVITVTATVKNVGAGTSNRGSWTGIYFSADSTITTSDRLLGDCWVGALPPGQEAPCTFQYAIPWNDGGATYYIGAIADIWNQEIDETSETNNTRTGNQIALTRVVYPDLVVTAVSGPTSAHTEEVITVTATVKNQGTGTSNRGSWTGIYFSTDNTITTSDRLLGDCWVGALPPGQEAPCTFQYAIPSNDAGATYYVGAIADIWNQEIDETDEGNNNRTGNQIAIQ